MEFILREISSAIFSVLFIGLFFVLPIALTVVNVLGLCGIKRVNKVIKRVNWFITITFGTICNCIYRVLVVDMTGASWDTQLYNDDKHEAIWSGGMNSFLFILGVGALGFLILCITKTKHISPIGNMICFAAMYLGCIELILYCIQLGKDPNSIPLFLLPANCLIMAATIIMEKIKEWNEDPDHQRGEYSKGGLLRAFNNVLHLAEVWPILAVFIMIPLLGIILCILFLFGQTPDVLVKTWTETADWTLSTKIPPQNLPMDTHYLCTVAAGGHPEIVKPIRMGERHGHAIVVNRQLQIANAFENVLEEKTPHFHRALRNFYDKYGFPVADYIRPHKALCDITYFVMKPLEWLFLLVLYTVDANPENRIAVQYIPKEKRQTNS